MGRQVNGRGVNVFVGSDQNRSTFRMLGALAACMFAAAAAAIEMTGTATAATKPHVSVYFVQGERLAPVLRPGTTALDAVRQLIAGPTRAESLHGFRTYVPASTRVRSATVANGIVTVDRSGPFATGTSAESMLARLAELVSTATAFSNATEAPELLTLSPPAALPP